MRYTDKLQFFISDFFIVYSVCLLLFVSIFQILIFPPQTAISAFCSSG